MKIYLFQNYNERQCSEMFLKQVIIEESGVPYGSIEIERSLHGKPYLKNKPNLHFNLSHTTDMLAIVIAKDPVGIDVENIASRNLSVEKISRIADRFFTPREQAYIFKTSGDEIYRFYEIWTKKEAYVKYLGERLIRKVKKIDVLEPRFSNKIKMIRKGHFIISVCGLNVDEKFSESLDVIMN